MPLTNPPGLSRNAFALDIAGVRVGYLKDFSGLAMEAEIVSENIASERVLRKHVAKVKWSTSRASVGLGMGKGMYDWVRQSLDGTFLATKGSFVLADFNYKAQTRLDFDEAVMTALTVPRLDGSSKEAAFFVVEFETGVARFVKTNGEDIRPQVAPKQKMWTGAQFRIEIGSLPCSRVASVESFTWKRAVAPDPTGGSRDPVRRPARPTVPDLSLSISMADYPAWSEAAQKWFLKGDFLQNNEMSGRIVLLSPDFKVELGEISLQGIGFKKFSWLNSVSNADAASRFNVELYVESMALKLASFEP